MVTQIRATKIKYKRVNKMCRLVYMSKEFILKLSKIPLYIHISTKKKSAAKQK